MPAPFHLTLTTDPLPPAPPAFPLNGTSGALLDFWGVVRGTEADRPIPALHYESYDSMARREFSRLADELTARHGVQELWLTHRLGRVPTGEPSLWVRVRAAHRAEAFACGQALIDRLKQDVPIWKSMPPETPRAPH